MWTLENPSGTHRVIVTRDLPGDGWRPVLVQADCRIETWQSPSPLTTQQVSESIGDRCDAVIGQLTETWDERMLVRLAQAGGRVYSNYAVGFNNVDIEAASRLGLVVTNTPGVLTRTTAELAVGLTLAAARRLIEGDTMVRSGRFSAWEPDLLLGTQLFGKVLGVVGAGRIGSTYALMMVRGFGMNLIYHGPRRKPELESAVERSATVERPDGLREPACRYEPQLAGLLRAADVVRLHPPLNDSSYHMIDSDGLALMKPEAVLVNVSRGPVIDEAALVEHCRDNPGFRAALDVFEDEPALAPGLADLPNVVLAPHIGSASTWTRQSMSILAARNVEGVLRSYPPWNGTDYSVFLDSSPPEAIPSVLNPDVLGGA